MTWAFTFRSMIHFQVIFVYVTRWGSELIFFHKYNQLTICVRAHWTPFCSVIYIYDLLPQLQCLDYCRFRARLEVSVSPLFQLFFPMIFVILGPLHFQINVCNSLSRSIKSPWGFLLGLHGFYRPINQFEGNPWTCYISLVRSFSVSLSNLWNEMCPPKAE